MTKYWLKILQSHENSLLFKTYKMLKLDVDANKTYNKTNWAYHIKLLGGVPCGAFYTTQIWVYGIQECLFLYSVYWFMAFTIKMPLSVNICLCFYLTHTSSSLVMVHPSHCFGGLARPLRCWARPLIYHKQGIKEIYIRLIYVPFSFPLFVTYKIFL